MSKEKPPCPIIGRNENVFVLMGIAYQTLRSNGYDDEAKEMMDMIYNEAGSYVEVMDILTEYVEPVPFYEQSIFEENEDLEI